MNAIGKKITPSIVRGNIEITRKGSCPLQLPTWFKYKLKMQIIFIEWKLFITENSFLFLKVNNHHLFTPKAWLRHQMETFTTLLALCAGNSPVTGEFPSQRPVTRGFDVCCDRRLSKWLSKQSRRRWFETPRSSLWRHSNETTSHYMN